MTPIEIQHLPQDEPPVMQVLYKDDAGKLEYKMYSIEQKDQFIADIGVGVAAPYIAMAGW